MTVYLIKRSPHRYLDLVTPSPPSCLLPLDLESRSNRQADTPPTLPQACLRGEVNARAFMSASLLAELAAIETIMTERAAQKERKRGATGSTQGPLQQSLTVEVEEGVKAAPPTTVIEKGVEVEREHTCAICLVSLVLEAILEILWAGAQNWEVLGINSNL